jgi:hypothetical protein
MPCGSTVLNRRLRVSDVPNIDVFVPSRSNLMYSDPRTLTSAQSVKQRQHNSKETITQYRIILISIFCELLALNNPPPTSQCTLKSEYAS